MICDLPWVILPATWTLPKCCSAATALRTHLSAVVAPAGKVVVVGGWGGGGRGGGGGVAAARWRVAVDPIQKVRRGGEGGRGEGAPR